MKKKWIYAKCYFKYNLAQDNLVGMKVHPLFKGRK